MVTDMDNVSHGKEKISRSSFIHLVLSINIYNKEQLQAADNLKFACTLKNIADCWLPCINKEITELVIQENSHMVQNKGRYPMNTNTTFITCINFSIVCMIVVKENINSVTNT